MSTNPTAQRALPQRIERFLVVLTTAKFNLDDWESVHLMQAFDCLDKEELLRGERDMTWIECPPQMRSPLTGADSLMAAEIPKAPQLRAKLKEILKGVA